MGLGRSRERCCVLLLLGIGLWGSAVHAEQQEEGAAAQEEAPAGLRPRLEFGLEAKANFRHSEDNRFPVNFGFKPEQFPPGQTQVFEETVNPGSHFEFSDVTLFVDAVWATASPPMARWISSTSMTATRRRPTRKST